LLGRAQFLQQFDLDLRAWRTVVSTAGDAKLIEISFFDNHTALFAGLAASADALDFHAQLASGIKHQHAVLYFTATAGWHQNEGVGVVGIFIRHVDIKNTANF